MTDPGTGRSELDRIREHVEGTLPAREADAMKAGLVREDAEFLDAYRAVSDALGPAAPETRTSRTTFAQLERRIAADEAERRDASRRWVRRAAAAAVLAAAVWAGARSARAPDVATVRLAVLADVSQPEPPDDAARAALACARILGEHIPMRGGAVSWFSSLDQARAVARVTGRPVLLFLSHPTCPVCAELEAVPLAAPEVRARIAQFVPAKVIASFDAPVPELDREWPYFAVLGADGLVLADLPVPASAAEFVEFLDAQIEIRIARTAPSWERARDLASRLHAACSRSPESAPRLAHDLLVALAADPGAGAFAAAARGILAEKAWSARQALVEAAAASATQADTRASRAILSEAVRRFAGTPYEPDLAAVLDTLVRTGRFPRIEPWTVPGTGGREHR